MFKLLIRGNKDCSELLGPALCTQVGAVGRQTQAEGKAARCGEGLCAGVLRWAQQPALLP